MEKYLNKEIRLKVYEDMITVKSPNPDIKYSAENSYKKLEKRIDNYSKYQLNPKKYFHRQLYIAASVVFFIICFGLLLYQDYRKQMMDLVLIENTSKFVESVELEDGTKIDLNANSKLIYPKKIFGTKREVLLIGEAYFDVAHNNKKPFIVRASNLQIKVLGTRFNVNAYSNSNNVVTTLLEGSVEVSTAESSYDKIIMRPNQVLTYNTTDGDMKLENTQYAKKQILWTKGIWTFDRMNVINIFDKLEQLYGVQFIILNKSLLNKYYTGELHSSDDLEDFLDLMKITKSFSYTKEENRIMIE